MMASGGFTVWSDFVQAGTLLLAVTILAFELWRIQEKNGGEITEPLLMIIWMLHTITFYIAELMEDLQLMGASPEGFFTAWSAALRLHGYTSLLIITLLRVNRRKLIKQKTEGILYGSDGTE